MGSYIVWPEKYVHFNNGYKEHSVACDTDRIAEHFLALHRGKILERFERLLPG